MGLRIIPYAPQAFRGECSFVDQHGAPPPRLKERQGQFSPRVSEEDVCYQKPS